jgi:uncharacterized membrane protein YphA (DoxX/SURF4 family)
MKKNTIVEVISAVLVFLFIYAAVSKLLDFDKFKYQISQSPFITNISRFVVWAIPIGELLISVALVVRRTRSAGLYSAFFLMLLFTGYIFIMLRYSPYLPCSCGGVLSGMSWKQHFVFNLAFTGLSLSGIVLQDMNSRKSRGKNTLTGMKLNT